VHDTSRVFIAEAAQNGKIQCMETQEKIESLIRQVTELPEEAQAEVVQSLLDLRSQHLGIYQLDQEERAALSHSAEDVRLGRFASDEEIEEVFAHFGA